MCVIFPLYQIISVAARFTLSHNFQETCTRGFDKVTPA